MKTFSMNDFHFKQFSIKHSSDVMKVGTDGVLIGAFVKPENAKYILDIGTGSGLISLMLAQKSKANIVGIDVNKHSVELANYNFAESKWSERLKAECSFLQQYVPSNKLDIIVSNPPFYNTDVYAPNQSRAIARHSTTLKYDDILIFCKKYLSETGKSYLIYPVDTANEMIDKARDSGLFANVELNIKSNYQSEVIRKIVCISKSRNIIDSKTICIEKEKRHDFTPEYIELTKDYYLKF